MMLTTTPGRWTALALAGCLAPGAAACGGDDSDGDSAQALRRARRALASETPAKSQTPLSDGGTGGSDPVGGDVVTLLARRS